MLAGSRRAGRSRGSFRSASAFVLGAITAIVLACAPAAAAQTDEAVLADAGFRASANGFGFANYGNPEGVANLTATEMRKLFGDQVCAAFRGERCVLSSTARSWMRSTNNQMEVGHCMGFAVTAQLWFEGLGEPPTPEPFGSSTTPALEVSGNAPLQSHIAYGWAFQVLPNVQEAEIDGKPSEILEILRQSLAPGRTPYVLTAVDQGGGHAITPYSIKRLADGRHRVLLYDNNHPRATRSLLIDPRRETWSFELGPGVVWRGNAATESLALVPIAAGVGVQPCFFCGEDVAAGPRRDRNGDRGGPARELELRWQGDARTGEHGKVFVTDREGRRSGCGKRGCVNRIPDAELWNIATGGVKPWTLSPPPVFRLPAGRRYVVSLTGGPLERPAREGVELIGDGFSVGASGIRLRRGERDRIGIAHNGHRIIFQNDRRQRETPTISLSTVAAGADYSFEVRAEGVRRGAQIGLDLDPRAQRLLILPHDRSGRGRYEVRMTRFTAESGQEVFEDELNVRSDQPVVIHYGRWQDQDDPAPVGR